MRFCTAINCMDGRVQLPVIRFLQDRFGAEYVDSITEPGPNRLLAQGTDRTGLDSILARVDISVHRHGSVGIAVVGHANCAGNPASRAAQAAQTASAAADLQQRYPDVAVVGLWVDAGGRVSEVPANGRTSEKQKETCAPRCESVLSAR